MRPKYTLLTQSRDFIHILDKCPNNGQYCELHLAVKNSSVPEPDVSTVMFMNVQNYVFNLFQFNCDLRNTCLKPEVDKGKNGILGNLGIF